MITQEGFLELCRLYREEKGIKRRGIGLPTSRRAINTLYSSYGKDLPKPQITRINRYLHIKYFNKQQALEFVKFIARKNEEAVDVGLFNRLYEQVDIYAKTP
jgi:hypothetical protein